MPLGKDARTLIRLALAEDLGSGDVTTRLLIPSGRRFSGTIVAKQPGVLCGLSLARAVFAAVDPKIRFAPKARDGARVRPGQAVAAVAGGRSILSAERVALNFLQHLSGVATLTAAYARELRGTRAALYDTRKTLPGWRALEKYAVRCGGGSNHRMGLYDAVMVKDNHLPLSPDAAARLKRNRLPLIIEAKTRREVDRALALRPDVLLLDNMGLSRLAREIRYARKQAPKVKIEVSGGVSFADIRRIARLGPDRISVGRISHSAPALDFSLELH